MATLVKLLIVASALATASAFLRRPPGLKVTKPEFWESSMQLARRWGYKAEQHKFFTSDGYEIVLHHIVASRNGTKGGVPVLFGHGMVSCDEQWYARGPAGAVYLIADHGYDVWTVNYRGSFYSRKHKTLSVKDRDFWDFSWHENAVIDEAEAIDYVLNATGYKKLMLVGHSMSGTAQVVLLAERPEYNDKVMGQLLMSPTILFGHATGAVAYGLKRLKEIRYERLEFEDHMENDWVTGLSKPLPHVCYAKAGSPNATVQPYCKRLFDFIMGRLHDPVDEYLLQLIIHHYPAGASIRQMVHYLQGAYNGRFSKFDFGKDINQEVYGQDTPPPYNLGNIRTPTYFLYGSADNNVHWKDVEIVASRLAPGATKKLHRMRGYNHIDYLVANDADKVVYPFMIKFLDEIKNASYES